MKKFWPVPQSYSKVVPESNDSRFRAKDYYIDMKSRKVLIWHSAVDIHCPDGSRVVATEDCSVVRVWEFTGPPDTPHYRHTWAINVRNGDGTIAVYGELRKPRLRVGQKIKAGHTIGYIAQIEYERDQSVKKLRCMLHFELYKKGTRKTVDWWPRNRKKPVGLLNPTSYLESCMAGRRSNAPIINPGAPKFRGE